MVVLLLSLGLASAGKGPKCEDLLARAALAKAWDLRTGAWDQAAVAKLAHRRQPDRYPPP